MIRMRTSWAVIGVCLLLSGCFGVASSPSSTSPTGTLLVHTSLPAQMSQSTTSVSLFLTKDKVERHAMVSNTAGSTVALELHDLPIGTWDALLQLSDESGNVTYEAKSKVNVFPSEKNVVTLRLQPMPGSVKVHVDLAGWNALPGDDPDIVEVKMTLSPGGTTTSKVQPGDTSVTLEKAGLTPQTVDFHLTLNVQGERNPVVFYNTPKRPVTVLPGTETVVYWTATTGDLEVIVDIDYFPNPPGNLSAVFENGTGIVLEWSPPHQDTTVVSYRIYERVDPFGDFKAIADVPATETMWEKHIVPGSTPLIREYAVSAVNEVYESVRTEPVIVHVPANL